MSNEIESMNEAIALFMGAEKGSYDLFTFKEKVGVSIQGDEGYEYLDGDTLWHLGGLQYHSSWDWLMPVVEKIEALNNRQFGFAIEPTSVIVTDFDKKEGEEQIIWVHEYPDNGDTKKSMTYDAVYQFIQWHNKQKAAQILMNLPQDKEPHGMPSLAADPFAQMEYRGPDSHCKACEEEKAGIKHIKAAKHTCKTKGGNNENNP